MRRRRRSLERAHADRRAVRAAPEVHRGRRCRRRGKPDLGLLRGYARYAELHAVADALLGHGLNDAVIKRQFAQALVDRDSPAAALLVYQGILNDPSTPEEERPEAMGGVGRCYKQLYILDQVSTGDAAPAVRLPHTARRTTRTSPLLARDQRRRAAGPSRPGLGRGRRRGRPGRGVAQVAREVLDLVLSAERQVCGSSRPPAKRRWRSATTPRRWSGRQGWSRGPTPTRSPSPRCCASWSRCGSSTPTSCRARSFCPLLRSAVLARDGGAVIVDARETRAKGSATSHGVESADGRNLEAVLGRERFKGMTWWLTGLERCRAVARIENGDADSIGTGFLVGRQAAEPRAARPVVLVTNGHVVPRPCPTVEAFAVFHGLVARQGVGPAEVRGRPMVVVPVVKVAGSSTSPSRSSTPIRRTSRRCPWLSICHRWGPRPTPRLRDRTPSGLDTPQFSLQDNLLLDYDDTLVHYRAPTEPGARAAPSSTAPGA